MSPVSQPPVVGLLGGVGSGKSTVARLLAVRGALVLDADSLAHDVLREPDVLRALTQRLGDGILSPDGSVDRKTMAEIIFGEGKEEVRSFVEGLVHPRVRARIRSSLEEQAATSCSVPLVVLDVPLLLESPLKAHCQQFIFVDAPPERRRELAAARGWPAEELEKREDAQTPIEEKRTRADHVIRNDGTLEDLERQTQALFDILSSLPPQPQSGTRPQTP